MAPKPKKKATPRKRGRQLTLEARMKVAEDRMKVAEDRIRSLGMDAVDTQRRMRELADRLTAAQVSLARHNERMTVLEEGVNRMGTMLDSSAYTLRQEIAARAGADAEQRERLAKLEKQSRTCAPPLAPLPVQDGYAIALARADRAERKLDELRARMHAAINVINGTN